MKNCFTKLLTVVMLLFCVTALYSCNKEEYSVVLDFDIVYWEDTEYTVFEGEKMPRLPSPFDDWCEFDGWYASKNGKEFKVSDGNKYILDGGKFYPDRYDIKDGKIIFTAKYNVNNIDCTVEFNTGDSQTVKHTVKYGDTIPEPTKPHSEIGKFIGWYTEKNGDEVMVHNGNKFLKEYHKLAEKNYDIVDFSAKIYAKYNPEEITATINTNISGTESDKEKIVQLYGTALELPIPERDHYDFLGWYTSFGGAEILIYDKNGPVGNKNVILSSNFVITDKAMSIYAKWEKHTMPVTFMLSNDENAASKIINVGYGEKITDYAEDIIINNKIVTKWSTMPNDTEFRYIFDSAVTEAGIKLYPAENKYYRITLFEDGDISTHLFEENETIELPSLKKNGYLFKGWKAENGEFLVGNYAVTKTEAFTAHLELKTESETTCIRSSGFSDPYIYTPEGVGGDPVYRERGNLYNVAEHFDIDALRAKGYTGFSVRLSYNMEIIDDGYQHIYVYNTDNISSASPLAHKEHGYSGGYKSDSLTFNVDFIQLAEGILSIRYAASGMFLFGSYGNQWNISNVYITLTPIK